MHNPLLGISGQLISAAKKIHLVVMDVDGVLTDGSLYYSSTGEEFKRFNIKDGLGIKLLQRAGIQTAIITGRISTMVEKRASELGIELLVQGREDKLSALKELTRGLEISLDRVAYIGDDLPDLSAIRAVGLGVTVADGDAQVAKHADLQTKTVGGKGAVRELAELILAAQDKYTELTDPYLS